MWLNDYFCVNNENNLKGNCCCFFWFVLVFYGFFLDFISKYCLGFDKGFVFRWREKRKGIYFIKEKVEL